MTITHISNTFGEHKELDLPRTEMLICSGGLSKDGSIDEVLDFLEWFDSQDHFYKIFIAGGEDWSLDPATCEGTNVDKRITRRIDLFESCRNNHYLYDSGVTIEKINIWGSPFSKALPPQAFKLESHKEAVYHWDKMPVRTDILITSDPPYDICDFTPDGSKADWCLRNKVDEVQPKLHLFGGHYYGRGHHFGDYTTFVNSACYDPITQKIREAQILDYHIQSGRTSIYKSNQYLLI